MATIKKYNGSTWENAVVRKYGTASEIITPPATIYADGTAISTYTIKGNTLQDGTPTPSNPVSVNGVGELTDNLLDFNALYDAPAGQMPDSSAFTFEHLLVLTLTPNTTYTLSSTGTGSTTGDADANRSLYYGGVSADYVVFSGHSVSYTTGVDGKVYVGFLTSRTNAQQYINGTATIMLNEGSTALPYEPYGQYKIPISSGQQTIDIYIGDLPLLKSLDGTAVDEISNGTLTRRVDSDGSVLPTPTTTQITMPSISTTDGANSITVDTTVQPSEFTATWTGWHNANVKEWDGSQWQ